MKKQVKEESLLKEIARMRTMMAHYRRLSLPSRNFITWMFVKYNAKALPRGGAKKGNDEH